MKIKRKLKSVISIILAVLTVILGITSVNAAVAGNSVDKQAYVKSKGNGLWLDAAPGKNDTTATLIKWNNFRGTAESQKNPYTFYVPYGVSLENATVYNGYNYEVTLNGTYIPAQGNAEVDLYVGDNSLLYGSEDTDSIKVMQGSVDSMFLNTTDEKGNDYDLPDSIRDSRIKLLTDNTYVGYDINSIKASGGKCTTISDSKVSDAVSLNSVSGRGTISWKASTENFGKYDFDLQLDSASSLLGLSQSKKYCLITNNFDQTMMRNAFTYSLAKDAELYNSPGFKYVDMYDNGMYLGTYLLTENIDVADNDKLIKGTSLDDIHDEIAASKGETVDKTTKTGTFTSSYGDIQYQCATVSENNISAYSKAYETRNATFLLQFELKDCVNLEKSWFKSPHGQYVVVKSPQFATEEEIKFIAEKFAELESKIYNSTISGQEYLINLSSSMDLDSFARMFLIQELAAAPDAAATSYFLTYTVSNGRFVASPVWDYEQAYGQNSNKGRQGMYPDDGGIYELCTGLDGATGWYAKNKLVEDTPEDAPQWNIQAQLANNTDFQTVIRKVWEGTDYKEGFYTIAQRYYRDSGTIDSWIGKLSDSVAMNEARWGFIENNVSSDFGTLQHGTAFENAAAYLKSEWIENRADWMNIQILDKFKLYYQIAKPTLSAYKADGTTPLASTSKVKTGSSYVLKASTSESYVQYVLYDNGNLVSERNTTGIFTVEPAEKGTHTYQVKTWFNSYSEKISDEPIEIEVTDEEPTTEPVTTEPVTTEPEPTEPVITDLKLSFKATNLSYLQPSVTITDSSGAVIMEKTPLTRGERIGVHFEGSYAFEWFNIDLPREYAKHNYTYTFTTNGSSMNASITPDLSEFTEGGHIYFAVDNLHVGTTAVDITKNETAQKECRLSVHMITNVDSSLQLARVSLPTVNGDGTQTVKTYKLGDVNRDNKLSIIDATEIQLKLAGISEKEENDNILCDFNIDGKMNIADATTLQLSLAGLY
ncbi:MAG: CotH kinase family protein [Oscillospiraceae bacterium]|nr:CotH kinase family protein [Oscillospiraceae bacterium]